MRLKLALLLVATPFVLAGCADARTGAVEEAATSFVQDLGSGDLAGACDLLAPATRERVERAGTCAGVLGGARLPAGSRVQSSEVWGTSALVRTAGDTLFLTETDGGWKVSAAGCRSRGEAPYDCAVEGP